MFVMIDLDSFVEDSRGSSIEKFEIVDCDGSLTAFMRGPRAAARQIESVYRERGLVTRALADDERPKWTHSFAFSGELRDRVERALTFFSEIVIIPSEHPLRSLIALGYYKAPKAGQAAMDWSNAPAGDLVNRAKYQNDLAAHRELVGALARVAKRHPWYSKFGQLVVSVPGHDATVRSFGERIAGDVARAIDRPLVKITALSESRPEAKAASRAQLDLSHEFNVEGDVAGKVVILVDDVYMTGRTMKNAAAVLTDSGARLVLGLVGARTMKAS